MDQVKVYLAILKKYHFWVITATLVILGLVGWKMGVGVLDDEYTTNRGRIESAFRQAGGVRAINPHPNQSFIEVVEAEHDQVKAQALQAWQILYDRQQEVMVWPREKLTDALVDAIERLKPNQEIPYGLRSNFENKAFNIPRGWKDTYELMQEVLPDEDDEEAEDNDPTYTGVVIWEGLDELEDRYKWGKTPRTDQILLAQEDFWIYETLLKIITTTNDGATEHYNAPIRQIVSLELAQQALQAPEVQIANALTESDRQSKEGKQSSSEVTVPLKDADAKALLAGRYIDELTGKPLPNGPKPGAVYKLLPIRMRLLMDQEKITQLCVACANSPVMVEPRQVLFVDEEASKAGSGKGAAGSMPLQPGPNACYVDLRGVAYLFYPPDRKRLQPANSGNTPVAAMGPNGPG